MKKNLLKSKVEDLVLSHYLKENRFSGITINELIESVESDVPLLKSCLIEQVNNSVIDFYNCPTNPFIKNFDPRNNITHQIDSINSLPDVYDFEKKGCEELKLGEITIFDDILVNPKFKGCVYPSEELLINKISSDIKYVTLPDFTKMLAFGKPQLSFLYFRIDVLDKYINDPRYRFICHDYIGTIAAKSDTDLNEVDEIYLKQFGLGYSESRKENLIAILLCDLNKLPESHQQYFKSFMIDIEDATPDRELLRNTLGEWPESVFIFSAFLEEITIINQMTQIICQKNLFKNDYSESDKRPNNFHPYLKPTKSEYHNLCVSLFKIFAENIDKSCIVKMNDISGNKINLDSLKKLGKADDKIKKLSQVGSLTLLEEFLKKYFIACDGSDSSKKVIQVWKKEIRDNRSRASHEFNENEYSKEYFKKFHNLMDDAYSSIRGLRLIFANHPSIRASIERNLIDTNSATYEGKIRNFAGEL